MATKSTRISDKFANMAFGDVGELVTGTLAFDQIHFGTSIREKVAIVIHKIEYYIAKEHINLIIANTDAIICGVTRSNGVPNLNWNQPAVIDTFEVDAWVYGTPATAQLYTQTFESDFTTMPGGGLITPADPLYVAVQGVSLASAIGIEARIYFTWKELKPEEYWELVETMRVIV